MPVSKTPYIDALLERNKTLGIDSKFVSALSPAAREKLEQHLKRQDDIAAENALDPTPE